MHAEKISELPDSDFYGVHQDSKLNYWFVANTGLYKFDGVGYYKYANDTSNKQLAFFNIKEDNLGRIWVNSLKGEFFCLKNNTLELIYSAEKESDGELSYEVFDNKLYYKVTATNEIFSIDIDTKKRSKVAVDDCQNWNQFVIFKEQLIFKNAKNNLVSFNVDTLQKNNNILGLGNNVLRIRTTKNHCFIISEDRKFKKKIELLYQNKLIKLELPLFLNKNKILKITEDLQGNLLFSTTKGLLFTKLKDNQFINKTVLFHNKSISDAIQDQFGNYIATSNNEGVFFFEPSFEKVLVKENSFLKSNKLSVIQKTINNHFLIGDIFGNVYFTELSNTVDHVVSKKVKSRIHETFFDDNTGSTFILSENDLTVITNKNRLITKPLAVKDIDVIDNNTFLICASTAAVVNKIGDNGFESIDNLRRKRSFSGVYIKKDSSYCIAFVDGVHVIKNGSIKPLFYKRENFYAQHIEKGDSCLWFLDKNGEVFYLTEEGIIKKIPSDKIKKLKKIGNKIYYLSRNAIGFINTKSNKLTVIYTIKNILLNAKIKDFDIIDNSIILATNKGGFISSLNKKEKINTILPKTYVKEFTVNNKKKEDYKNVVFKYDENNIAITIRNQDALGILKYNYQYKLSNNETWVDIPNIESSLRFYNLQDGDYNITIRTRNSSLVEIHSLPIKFTIKLPFWKTVWFLTFSFILLLGSVLVYMRFRIQTLNRKQTLQLEKVTLEKNLAFSKLQNLKNQMNPHFMFNAMNSIQSLILKGKKQEAYTYLTKFSQLIRENLNRSEKTFVYIDEEISLLDAYLELEKLRFKTNFNYQIVANNIEAIKVPTMIIQPFVENAIKHGLLHKDGLKVLTITFTQTNVITCVIEDNGIGRQASQHINENKIGKPKSFSTGAIAKRFNLLKESYNVDLGFEYIDLEDNNGSAIGTRVIIKIPYVLEDE
ncbi:sensor histidine kinase [Lacinutrix jangbogonensis]|uniref:sensor histidine kinase n=1 Tax=Lacinutrix jangbogonensis TaxID=1469557 RepID=UPI00053D877E|nr:histidine kinase [Lacinutrix jangbogonensis]